MDNSPQQPNIESVGADICDAELLAVKLRRIQLLRQKHELMRQFGLPFYRPHPKQDEFHRAGARYNRRMVRAGNRFGKSLMGVAEDCAWVLNERVWYPESDVARRSGIPQRPVKLLTITTDWDKVGEIFTSFETGKVWQMLPKDFAKPMRTNHSGVVDRIKCANGSMWFFDTVKSFMSNPQGTESSDWDAIHVDEPCPELMWKAASRGLMDRGGSAWFTLTPLREFWINDYFFPQDTGGNLRPGVWAITGSTYDNTYLSRAAIEDFERDLTDEEKACRIQGIPLHLSGLVYKEFQYSTHVLQDVPLGWFDWNQPPINWPVYVTIDPHPQTPHAVLFCTVDPFGQLYVFNELFVHCSTEELVRKIFQTLQYKLPNGVAGTRRILWAKADPLAYINEQNTQTSMATEMERFGLYVEKATKALEYGITETRGLLRKRPTAIFFSPACKRTLWEIQRYCWDEGDNKPLDENDHMMENLYRMVISEPRWIDVTVTTSPVEDIVIDKADLSLEDFTLN